MFIWSGTVSEETSRVCVCVCVRRTKYILSIDWLSCDDKCLPVQIYKLKQMGSAWLTS